MQENIFTEMPPVREWKRVDRKRFEEEIVPLNRPAIIRGLVNHWPAVNAARESPQALAEFVRPFSKEQPISVFQADAGIRGRFFYDDALQGFNFKHEPTTIGGLLTRLVEGMTNSRGPPCTRVPLRSRITCRNSGPATHLRCWIQRYHAVPSCGSVTAHVPLRTLMKRPMSSA